MKYFIYIFLSYHINGEQKPMVTASVLTDSTFSFYVPDLGQTTWNITEEVKYVWGKTENDKPIKAIYTIEKDGVRGFVEIWYNRAQVVVGGNRIVLRR